MNPQDASTLGDLAFYYAKNGDSKKGLEFIRRARSIDAKDNELMYKEAVINALAGQASDALASLRAALAERLFGAGSQERSGAEDSWLRIPSWTS